MKSIITTHINMSSICLIINMLHQCSCWITVNDISTTPITVAPKLFFDIETQLLLCGMKLDSNNYGYNEINIINIYMNTPSYVLLSTLPACVVHQSDGRDFLINNLISHDPTAIVQEYITIELWNPVSSI